MFCGYHDGQCVRASLVNGIAVMLSDREMLRELLEKGEVVAKILAAAHFWLQNNFGFYHLTCCKVLLMIELEIRFDRIRCSWKVFIV